MIFDHRIPVAHAEQMIQEHTIKFRRPHVRTFEDMEATETALREAGRMPATTRIVFRPTINKAAYKAAKSAARTNADISQPIEESSSVLLKPPTLKGLNIDGVNEIEAGGFRPPDTHGAVGLDHFIEITNSNIDVYKKSDGTRVKSISLASFFGYTKQPLFDPRCVYDSADDRWIVSAEAFQESSTIQRQFVAVSKTSDPLGSYNVYSGDVNFKNNDDFWDFPQLGVDSKAIIITANIFGPKFYRETRMVVADKARLYNGLSARIKLFTGLDGTLAPPIVLDDNNKTFLVAAISSGIIRKYTLTYPGGIPTLSSSNITVPAYSVPPNAKQPGTPETLDTSDLRFVNASTQVGNSLWQVHTINVNGLPKPKFYEFNTSTNTIIQSGIISSSATSNDWNASITANADNDVFVTWSSTDPNAGVHAQVRFSGRLHTDPLNTISSGSALFTSSTFYNPSSDTPERWGDYSAVTVDPKDPLRAWVVNEKINTSKVWGSRIGEIGF
ncbi:MAG: hypothetical protein CV087_13400 [Candidatus Brocadia sp. WS118]|nr:MAG: hypothetical protein CV087_13400 [Candidatus Brocadia sp. WS118]